MFTITKTMYTETGHRLMDYEGRCAHVHGHSYKWEITLAGSSLDHRRMLADFKDLKKVMMAVIDPFDHALVLNAKDPILSMGIPPDELFRATNGDEPRLIIWPENPTAESFAQTIREQMQDAFHSLGIKVLKVAVWETATSNASHCCTEGISTDD